MCLAKPAPCSGNRIYASKRRVVVSGSMQVQQQTGVTTIRRDGNEDAITMLRDLSWKPMPAPQSYKVGAKSSQVVARSFQFVAGRRKVAASRLRVCASRRNLSRSRRKVVAMSTQVVESHRKTSPVVAGRRKDVASRRESAPRIVPVAIWTCPGFATSMAFLV